MLRYIPVSSRLLHIQYKSLVHDAQRSMRWNLALEFTGAEARRVWWPQCEGDREVNQAAGRPLSCLQARSGLVWVWVLNLKTLFWLLLLLSHRLKGKTRQYSHMLLWFATLMLRWESYSAKLRRSPRPTEPVLSSLTAEQIHHTGMMSPVVTSGQDVSQHGNRPTVGSHPVRIDQTCFILCRTNILSSLPFSCTLFFFHSLLLAYGNYDLLVPSTVLKTLLESEQQKERNRSLRCIDKMQDCLQSSSPPYPHCYHEMKS